MTGIAVAALCVGAAAGFLLARRFFLRTLVALMLGLVALVLFVANSPAQNLPGEGHVIVIAAYLGAVPMAAGLLGGAVLAWLFRNRTKVT